MNPTLRDQLHELARLPELPEAVRAPILQALLGETSLDADTVWGVVPRRGRASQGVVPPAHLKLIDLVARGGMGEVWRARDLRLDTVVALKTVRDDLAESRAILALFDAEARVTASLAHPGIPPVHERGDLEDGRPYYTMKLLEGRSLLDAFGAHGPLTTLITVLHRVCEAVGYAHGRGVIHRDLKPENVHLGANDEVIVLDWGIARATAGGASGRGVHTGVAGTVGYMAPEQERGERALIGPASDVFALGRMLGEALTEGLPTLVDDDARVAELAALRDRATQAHPDDRPADARALAAELHAWLRTGERRARAVQVLREADEALTATTRLRIRAAEARQEAELLGAAVHPSDPETAKRAWWTAEDRALTLERAADQHTIEAEVLLNASLTHAHLPDAHERLATLYRQRHVEAEARKDAPGVARWELLLKNHDRGEHAAYLTGNGALTLTSDPPGAEARLYRYERRDRRLVPVLTTRLGKTPVVGAEVPHGSWLVELVLPGHALVRHPVLVRRLEHVEAGVLTLPRLHSLGADDCVVTPGWTWFGGDPGAPTPSPTVRAWQDGCVMRRFPVTNAEYLTFINDLVLRGRADEAERLVPRESRANHAVGTPVYRWAAGRWQLGPDADGDLWLPDWPVMLVTFAAANAYAAWEAERTGLPWRLPNEREWERAARGADGRIFPWGDHLDPSFALYRESWPAGARPQPRASTSHTIDESPFRVRGLAGGMRDWCHDAWGDRTEHYSAMPTLRGGGWNLTAPLLRSSNRSKSEITFTSPSTGFRLARDL